MVLRANIPTAVASTLVTNPVTFAPIYYGAYHIGATLLGDDGKPLLLGLIILACSMGVLACLLVSGLWRLKSGLPGGDACACRRARLRPSRLSKLHCF